MISVFVSGPIHMEKWVNFAFDRLTRIALASLHMITYGAMIWGDKCYSLQNYLLREIWSDSWNSLQSMNFLPWMTRSKRFLSWSLQKSLLKGVSRRCLRKSWGQRGPCHRHNRGSCLWCPFISARVTQFSVPAWKVLLMQTLHFQSFLSTQPQ